MRTLRLLAIPLAAALGARAEPYRIRLHPPPHEISVNAIAAAPDGFLWLAAGDGVYRFDGLHYQRLEGFPLKTTEFIAVTAAGIVWAGSAEGLARFDGKFKLVARGPVSGLAALGNDVFASVADELYRFPRSGAPVRIRHSGNATVLDADPEKGVCFVQSDYRIHCLHRDAGRESRSPAVSPIRDIQQALHDGKGRLWFGSADRVLSEDGKQRYTRRLGKESRGLRSLFRGLNGQVWFLGETLRGLSPPREFSIGPSKSGLPRRAGYEDGSKRIWVDDHGHGLVEISTQKRGNLWRSSEFRGSSISQTVREDNGRVLAVTYDAGLYRLDEKSLRWRGPLGPHRKFYSALPLPDGTLLASLRGLGVAHLSADGKLLQTLRHDLALPNEYREIVRDAQKRIWATNKNALFRVKGSAGAYQLRHEVLPGELDPNGEARKRTPSHPVDLEIDAQGRLWAGYEHGLVWLDHNGQWHRIATDRPIRSVRSFTFGGNGDGGEIWVAYRVNRPFSRLLRNGDQWKVTDFSAEAGYTPPRTHFLKRDSRGWIWRGSRDGVHVSDGKRFQSQDWLHFAKHNGLAADEIEIYGFREDPDGSVWISGEEGLSHIHPNLDLFDWRAPSPSRRPPRITLVQADGGALNLFPPAGQIEFRPGTLRMRFEIGSFSTSPYFDAPFRYRIQPALPEWMPARNSMVEVHDIQEGKDYKLDVAYSDAPLQPALTYTFRIGPPAAQTPWVWLLSGLGGAALAARPLLRSRWVRKLHYRLAKKLRPPPPEAPSAAAPADLTGETLGGRYRLERLLSRGGFSDVYEAGGVAVKVLHRKSTEAAWTKDRFAHEVTALRQIDHPGVVPLLDSWIEPGGRFCLVMPLLEGRTLREAMDTGWIDIAATIRIAGDALSALHSRGVVHRDLKPENIMLVERGGFTQPVLIDFGNAGLVGLEEGMGTTTLLSGSAYYMAPEQLLGHYAPASDIYSFGCIILEMLTGCRPAELARASSDAGFEKVLVDALDSAGINEPGVAAKLAGAFVPEPARRPSHAAKWAHELADLLERKI